MRFRNSLFHIVRRLVRAPLFTAATLLTLAIGIGANTAIFSVVESVLLKPLPYTQPDRLVYVSHTAMGVGLQKAENSPTNYFVYREQGRAFQDIGLWSTGSGTVTGLGEPEQVRSMWVTDGFLPVLGVYPILGRTFTHQDDTPGSPETVMLAYGFWQRKFGGERSAIGRQLIVDGRPREIIGVLPAGFRFQEMNISLLRPQRFERKDARLGDFSYEGLARLKHGVTIAQANADVARMIPIVFSSFPAPPGISIKMFEEARFVPDLSPLKTAVVGDIGGVLWVLMGTIGIVLLIACANVANLLLVRAEGRRQELAIRAALGAGWGHIAGELVLESLTLGVAGGAIGLGLAWTALRGLVAMAPAGLPRLDEIHIDPWALAFTAAVSLVSSAFFGLIPVLKYVRPQMAGALRQGGRGSSHSRERHLARNVLVVAQVSLALLLLVGSGLMIRTFQALRKVDPGFHHPEEVQTLRISIPSGLIKDPLQVVRKQREILEKVAAVPGVRAAGFSSSITMDGASNFDPIFCQDRTYADGKMPPLRRFKFASPGFVGAVQNPLIAGRDFNWADIETMTPVAIVTENLAREYWHTPSEALGKRIRESMTAEWRTIIGVVGNERDDGVDKSAPTTVYWPALLKHFWDEGPSVRRSVNFAIRSNRTGTESFLKEIRQAVWSVNSNLPLADVRTLDEVYRKSMARTSFLLLMLAVAGGMALLLGLIGVYGVISYSVSQRTREIGIRMALGARQMELTGMFLRQGLTLTGIGVACGLVAAVALTRGMHALLFQVQPVDPITYGSVAVVLALAAAAASYVPSRRAASVEPVEALRSE